MKTNIRTILTIALVGIIGLSTNAANLKSNSTNFENLESTVAFFNEESTVDFRSEALMLTKWTADKEEAKATQKLIEAGLSGLNENKETTETNASNTETTVFNLDENREAVVDYLKEAQLIAKMVADNAEAKVIQKLVEEGKIAENK